MTTKPVKYKKLVYAVRATNRFQCFKYEQFLFTFDRNLRPIPVEVPEEIADKLLALQERGCRCHGKKERKPLFREVE